MQTGDNMLAIYASEKALRLAERLGETRAASRAHGIFGRVFGRIGDTAKARENLERAVELARGSDDGETILALLALGPPPRGLRGRLPAARGGAYREALALAEQVGDVPAQVELHAALAQLAALPRRLGRGRAAAEASAELAEREGLVGKLCLPVRAARAAAWREGDWDEAESLLRRAHELAEQVGWSEVAFSALFGLARALRDRGDYAGAGDGARPGARRLRAGRPDRAIQAIGARAAVLALDGRGREAGAAAAAIEELVGGAAHPVSVAAATEARGAAAADPDAAGRELREAAGLWEQAGRPLNAIRTRLLLSRSLWESEPAAAVEILEEAIAAAERLDVPHFAATARSELSSRG